LGELDCHGAWQRQRIGNGAKRDIDDQVTRLNELLNTEKHSGYAFRPGEKSINPWEVIANAAVNPPRQIWFAPCFQVEEGAASAQAGSAHHCQG
jgi:hypothetical protein